MHNTWAAAAVVAFLFLAVGCSGGEPAAPPTAREDCGPTPFEQDSLMWGELRATPEPDLDAWALLFATYDPGDEVRIPVDHEVKIVWRVGGTGDMSFVATGPDRSTVEPTWGQVAHGGSNWERPGDEFGTGWVFPTEGCWILRVQRGGGVATLAALVQAQAAFDLE